MAKCSSSQSKKYTPSTDNYKSWIVYSSDAENGDVFVDFVAANTQQGAEIKVERFRPYAKKVSADELKYAAKHLVAEAARTPQQLDKEWEAFVVNGGGYPEQEESE